MAETNETGTHQTARDQGGLFAEPKREPRSFPIVPIAIALVAVALIAAVVFLVNRHHGPSTSPDTLRPVAAYAGNLKLTQLAMSESTSFSGGKSTFLDGHIENVGSSTVTGLTAQVLFASDAGGPPQLETVPVTLVRTRQPYLDTEPVASAPLAPGAGADFRLTFEGIRPEWNQQLPVIHLVEVTTR